MDAKVRLWKRRLDRELRHIKLILVHCRASLSAADEHLALKEWLFLVDETKHAVLESPEEFFCVELPPATIFKQAIEEVFQGFLVDQRLRLQQRNIYFKVPSQEKKVRRRR